uniref:Uncharacterized protein n=1 Tax=Cannabis sativa TaxID=3483 RepID=A0A803QUB7_CANSA
MKISPREKQTPQQGKLSNKRFKIKDFAEMEKQNTLFKIKANKENPVQEKTVWVAGKAQKSGKMKQNYPKRTEAASVLFHFFLFSGTFSLPF